MENCRYYPQFNLETHRILVRNGSVLNILTHYYEFLTLH